MKQTLGYVPEEALTHLRAGDSALAGVIEQVGPFTLELSPAKSLFEALLKSIIYQQLHGKAASTIHGRVMRELRRHGGPTPAAWQKLRTKPCAPPASPATNCLPSATLP